MTQSSPGTTRENASWLHRSWVLLVAAAVIALIAGFLGGFGAGSISGTSNTSSRSSRSVTSVNGGSCDAVHVADDVLPTIVTINVTGADGSGVGSGEIIKNSGYIVTNNHVISPAANGGDLSVVFSSGQQKAATLVGRDPKSDLAVLKVTLGKPLPTIALGDSSTVDVGQPVVALGAPLGLSSTVTAGIVSALGRDVPVPSDNGATAILAGAIQTDASINPGNSGGALVNCAGALIGVNTAIATVPNAAGQAGGGSVGIGFAVPVNLMKTIVDSLIKTGTVAYPYFGVEVAPLPDGVAKRFGVEDGLFVQAVTPNGPSAQAGIRAGDVITTIDGRPAARTDVLTAVTMTKKAGDTITVGYVRNGKHDTTTVTLGTQP